MHLPSAPRPRAQAVDARLIKAHQGFKACQGLSRLVNNAASSPALLPGWVIAGLVGGGRGVDGGPGPWRVRAPGLLLAQFQVEAMQEVMKGRRQKHRDHRQEEDAAEQRVCDGEDLRGRRSKGCHGTHPRENHRGIECRIQPRQVIEEVIASRPDTQRPKDQPAHEDGVSSEPADEHPPRDQPGRVRHTDEYTDCG